MTTLRRLLFRMSIDIESRKKTTTTKIMTIRHKENRLIPTIFDQKSSSHLSFINNISFDDK